MHSSIPTSHPSHVTQQSRLSDAKSDEQEKKNNNDDDVWENG